MTDLTSRIRECRASDDHETADWLEGKGRWHSYLKAFPYDDVESGDLDDYTPKIGDFVYLHHQRDHDGYETDNPNAKSPRRARRPVMDNAPVRGFR